MLDRYCHSTIPPSATVGCAVDDLSITQAGVGLAAEVEAAMSRLAFSNALEAIMRLVAQANQYIEAVAPWNVAKQANALPRLEGVLRILAEVLRILAIVLDPFMPSVAATIWQQLGCGAAPRRLQDASQWMQLQTGQAVGPHPVLFPRTQQSVR